MLIFFTKFIKQKRAWERHMVISMLIGIIIQVVLYSLIPFIWWLTIAREKMNFFSWIGLKKIDGNKTVLWTFVTALFFLAVSYLSL